MIARENLRNIAIIAHVDHGKTTLVDHMLRQAGVFRSNEHLVERVMDSNDLEREKGITILAKNASVRYAGTKINIADTPGHADFGGEVERALRLVDGVLLLVDAAEGPLPQTRFVLQKALALHLPAVVVINKIDRPDARAPEVLDAVYSLFIDLGADEHQLNFPVIYTIAKQGLATADMKVPGVNLQPLFEAIVKTVPPPKELNEGYNGLQMLVQNLDYDDYVGRLAVGRITAGVIRPGMWVSLCKDKGVVSKEKIQKLYGFEGVKRVELTDAAAGEIVVVSGIEDLHIGDTIAEPEEPRPLPRIYVDEPTMSMIFKVNDGPFSGREGKYVTSRNIKERLLKEAYRNPSIRIEDTESADAFRVVGRGELQLAIIVETMRREGFELCCSNPEPVTRIVNGELHEPMELMVCDMPETAVGGVTERLGPRKGRMTDMVHLGSGRVRLTFRIPARGLIGFRTEYLTITRGEGIMSSQPDGYEPWQGNVPKRTNGALVSDADGESTAYDMFYIQDRGQLFIPPQTALYEGMVIGENAHPNDLNLNIVKGRKLTNIRAAGRDENIILTPPRVLSLEQALEWINSDELVEVTPKSVRIRKKSLSAAVRYREERDRKREAQNEERR
jgi:GTP-binding protein